MVTVTLNPRQRTFGGNLCAYGHDLTPMSGSKDQIALELLVLSAQAGDLPALERVIAYCQPLVLAHVYRLIDDRESARDVCQETLLAVARGLAVLSDPRSFRPWMYRIATFKSRDW